MTYLNLIGLYVFAPLYLLLFFDVKAQCNFLLFENILVTSSVKMHTRTVKLPGKIIYRFNATGGVPTYAT